MRSSSASLSPFARPASRSTRLAARIASESASMASAMAWRVAFLCSVGTRARTRLAAFAFAAISFRLTMSGTPPPVIALKLVNARCDVHPLPASAVEVRCASGQQYQIIAVYDRIPITIAQNFADAVGFDPAEAAKVGAVVVGDAVRDFAAVGC